MISTILFIWAKMNPEIDYRQGMNDLLGTILFNFFKETPLHTFKPKTKFFSFVSINNYSEWKKCIRSFLIKNTGLQIFIHYLIN